MHSLFCCQLIIFTKYLVHVQGIQLHLYFSSSCVVTLCVTTICIEHVLNVTSNKMSAPLAVLMYSWSTPSKVTIIFLSKYTKIVYLSWLDKNNWNKNRKVTGNLLSTDYEGSVCSVKQDDGCFMAFHVVSSENNVTIILQRTTSKLDFLHSFFYPQQNDNL